MVRAIAYALGQSWDTTYVDLFKYGMRAADMPSANAVWGAYLRDKGFLRHPVEDSCPECYTVYRFCEDHPRGTYVLALDGHVVAVHNGHYTDVWDSGDETVLYYWERG